MIPIYIFFCWVWSYSEDSTLTYMLQVCSYHFSIIKATLVLDLEPKGRVGEIEKRKPWKVG